MAIKIFLIVFGILLAAFFAGAETGIYRMSRFGLRIGIERKQRFFATLGQLINDTHGLILSMLIGTNLAQYIVTSTLTIMLVKEIGNENTAELYSTLIIAPVLFVFSELIPKNVFIYYADRLMPPLTPAIWFFHKIFVWLGIVGLLKFIAGIVNKITKSPHSAAPAIVAVQRHHISQIAAETIEEGILSSAQSRIIHRLVDIPDVHIAGIVTPIRYESSVSLDVSKSGFIKKASASQHTRLLVYKNSPANIIGFANVYEVLGGEQEFESLSKFVKPLTRLQSGITISQGLKQLKAKRERIAIVVTEKQKTLGVVTVKDLVEEYIGELTDI